MERLGEQDNIFINRELSWLDFNRRVLALAKDRTLPLAERMKFIAIYGSNLDEFFMVRVGSLYDQTLVRADARENKTNMTPGEQLKAIMVKTRGMQSQCDKYWQKLCGDMSAQGYEKIDFEHLDKESEKFWKKYFERELYPVLSPQIVDYRHPFPFLRNKEMYLCASLKDKKDGTVSYGFLPISSQFERLLYIKKDSVLYYGLVEELLCHFVSKIFDKGSVQNACIFRVTRNADITVEEGMLDHDIDFREVMTELLKKRRKLAAIRIQFSPNAAPDVISLLQEKLVVPQEQCFIQQTPLDLNFLFRLCSYLAGEHRDELFYLPAKPMMPPAGYSLAEEVKKHDVLLAYPYQSIRPFIKMLNEAAADPSVVSIKMTLYRMADESKIVEALLNAAENGKEVVTVVELRARFDEQNNIDWSRQLERAGCTVIYGFGDYKVHSKLTVITRREKSGYSYVTQIGTGNYNEKTSEQYADLSYITSDPALGEEAAGVFNDLAVERLTPHSTRLLVAPLCFKSILLEEIDREISASRNGGQGRMILKNNSISDKEIIQKLAEASKANVKTDMIVRGICCVQAQIPGQTENLQVRSLVGRYLEHARIYAFGAGENLRVYIASGDFLTRNTERRVEVGVHITDPVLQDLLYRTLQLQLRDTANARVMNEDGSFSRVKPMEGQPPVDSQMEMYNLFRDSWTAGTARMIDSQDKEQKAGVFTKIWRRLFGKKD